jgi:hypothetical protein
MLANQVSSRWELMCPRYKERNIRVFVRYSPGISCQYLSSSSDLSSFCAKIHMYALQTLYIYLQRCSAAPSPSPPSIMQRWLDSTGGAAGGSESKRWCKPNTDHPETTNFILLGWKRIKIRPHTAAFMRSPFLKRAQLVPFIFLWGAMEIRCIPSWKVEGYTHTSYWGTTPEIAFLPV